MRGELRSLATKFNCKLRFHKKSIGFVNWLKGRHEPVLLIADWREAKPIQVFLGNSSVSYDVCIYVIAESDKILQRASGWFAKQAAVATGISLGFFGFFVFIMI